MAKYRLLFLLISVILWGGILYAVSKVRPTLIQEIFAEDKVIKADKDKKAPPPPPPPPPPEKLPPPPPLVERKTVVVVDIPRDDPPERIVVDKPPPPPRDPPETFNEPEPSKCPNPAFKQASGGGAIGVSYNPPDGSGSGSASASLDINSSGRVSNFSFTDRSGNALFDQAFESAAKARTYDAALRECFAVDGGKVTVSASFSSPEIKKVEPPPPSCREAATAARKLRPFNIERAYPQRAIDRGQEGTVSATLQISDAGDVVGVVITSENPPGVFGTAVEREARRMKYSPARRECANVADSVPLQVQFKLGE